MRYSVFSSNDRTHCVVASHLTIKELSAAMPTTAHESTVMFDQPQLSPVRRSALTLCMAVALLALLQLAAPAPADAQLFKRDKPYADGTPILIQGVVSDLGGNPIPDLLVSLTARRYSRVLDNLEREVSVSTRSNERGEYALEWVWYRYYNDFELTASVEVPTGTDQPRNEVVASTQLNNRIAQGSPVIAPLTITEGEFLATFKEFINSINSDDEQRVYDTLGRPDKVDALDLPNSSEEAWWYFAHGQVYRFISGRLDQVETFDPIRP